MEKVTIDVILDWLKKSVEEKQVVDAHTWVSAGMKLNILISEEHDKLFNLQQAVAQLKMLRIESGDSVAKAKIAIEATNEYREMKKQEARIGMIEEAIRLAKVQSRLKSEEAKNY